LLNISARIKLVGQARAGRPPLELSYLNQWQLSAGERVALQSLWSNIVLFSDDQQLFGECMAAKDL
jgi:hypothetical protein